MLDERSDKQLSELGSAGFTFSEAFESKGFFCYYTTLSTRRRDVLVEQHANTVQISASRRRVDVTFLLDKIDTEEGLFWLDFRGNLYAIVRMKSKDSFSRMYKLVLLHANWKDIYIATQDILTLK